MGLRTILVATAVTLAAGAALDRCAPIVGARHTIARVEAERDGWESAASQWQAAAQAWNGRANAWRERFFAERRSSRLAVEEVEAVCTSRIARARQSAAAIAALFTKEPPRDPNGCPVRTMLDDDRLRGAVWPEVPGR